MGERNEICVLCILYITFGLPSPSHFSILYKYGQAERCFFFFFFFPGMSYLQGNYGMNDCSGYF